MVLLLKRRKDEEKLMLKDVLANTPIYEIIGPRRIDIKGISLDPADVDEGYLYIYSPDTTAISYQEAIDLAIQGGAVAICIGKQDEALQRDVTYLRTYNYTRFLSAVARNFYHNPSQNMQLVGITGSHGKTTVGWMLKSILNVAGIPCATVGTSFAQISDQSYVSCEGDMNPLDMNALLHEAVKQKVRWGIIECAYTGIVKEKFRHVWFDSVIYTDLYTYFKNQKEDYHYFEIRKTLIDHLKYIDSPVIVNVDDFYTSELEYNMLVGYGLYGKADVRATNIELFSDSSRFMLNTPIGNKLVTLRVPGIHNVYNALAAAAWGVAHKLSFEHITRGIEDFKCIPYMNEEIIAAEKITIDYVEPAGPSHLNEVYGSVKDIPKDKIATILCMDDTVNEETLSSLKPIIIQNSGLCTITSDYQSSPDKMKMVVPLYLKELEEIGARYDLDHYKGLQKMINRLKDGGHIFIVSGKWYNVSGKE